MKAHGISVEHSAMDQILVDVEKMESALKIISNHSRTQVAKVQLEGPAQVFLQKKSQFLRTLAMDINILIGHWSDRDMYNLQPIWTGLQLWSGVVHDQFGCACLHSTRKQRLVWSQLVASWISVTTVHFV